MSGTVMDAVSMSLLREAAEWRLIGLLLEHPGHGWHEEVRALASQVIDPELTRATRTGLEEASEGAYLAALGPGGVASPREVAYGGYQDPGNVLADVTAFYSAFDYRPQPSEPPDHVAVEAGFIEYLRLKEAYARSAGMSNDADIAAKAAETFITDHLSAVAEPLAERLAAAGNAALVLAGRALFARVGPPQRRTVWSPCSDSESCPGACEGISEHDSA